LTMASEKRPPTSLPIATVCMAHGREERGARHVLVRERDDRGESKWGRDLWDLMTNSTMFLIGRDTQDSNFPNFPLFWRPSSGGNYVQNNRKLPPESVR
jgi:hypothetical protein